MNTRATRPQRKDSPHEYQPRHSLLGRLPPPRDRHAGDGVRPRAYNFGVIVEHRDQASEVEFTSPNGHVARKTIPNSLLRDRKGDHCRWSARPRPAGNAGPSRERKARSNSSRRPD